jgi:biofilm PGA synthesis lipoprotein PgaB
MSLRASVALGLLALTASISACSSPEEERATVSADDVSIGTIDWPAPRSTAATRVPVVVFHGLCQGTCAPSQTYSIPVSTFDEMMSALVARGYEALSDHDYALYLLGRRRTFAKKPILITFDDGRADGYLGADPVLERYGLRATSFLITAMITDKRGYYVSWADVKAASPSGRWDMQVHAHAGHTTVPTGPADETGLSPQGSAYAWRRWQMARNMEHGELETHEEWHARVSCDLDTAVATLREKLPTFTPLLFAVPFGDYGEFRSNDPRISADLRRELDHRFFAWFTQESENPAFTPPVPYAEHHRFRVDATVTTAMLLAWLSHHGG